jgi:DNA-binding CsgD family transcriptional regulator/tetratricopeptide (TPR) repeat protein
MSTSNRTTPPAGLTAPIVRGRDRELAQLGEGLDQVRSGHGAVTLVEGSAGMGKSRLLEEAGRMARRLSFRVVMGGADPGSSVVEMAALMGALADGPTPVIDPSDLRDLGAAPEQRYWLLHDLQRLLEQAVADEPLLVALDDVQWADTGTAAGLRALPIQLRDVPLMWVIAFRPDQGSAEVQEALARLERGGAERLVLGPLDQDAVAQVAGDVMRAEPDAHVLEVARDAQGSPFVLVELLSGMREEGLVRIEAGRAELLEARLPDRVRQTMRERLTRVSVAARQVATVAASLGRRFAFGDLATMLDLAPSALLAPVEELTGAGFLVERGDELSFQHDLIREAVRGTLPVSAVQALDRQAVDVILAAGASPVEVAIQLAGSAKPGDEVAIATLLKAAEALSTTDPGAGVELSRRALELAPENHPLRGPLVAQTAVSLHAAGHMEEATAFADTALRHVLPPSQEAEVRLSIAAMFRISPDIRAETGRRALALPGLADGIRSEHLGRLFYNLLVGGRAEEARALIPEADAAVQASGHPGAAFALELGKGGLAYVDGRFASSLEVIEAAIRVGHGARDHARERIATQFRCGAMIVLDRVDEAMELAIEGAAAAERDRQAWALHMLNAWRGRELQQLGRLGEAAALLEGRFAPEDAHLLVAVGDAAGVVALGRIALHTGDARQARQAAEIANVLLEQTTPGVRRHAAWLLALQAMDSGDAVAAREWLCALGVEERKSILPRFPMDLTDEVQLVRIAVAAGDRELAESGVAAAERRAKLNPEVRSVTASAAHARGLLDDSQADLADAVELFEQSPRLLGLAAALEDLAGARAERKQSAVAKLDRALLLYDQASATRDAGRVRARLRELGVRRRLVSTERPEHGWAGMTDSELVVARLVAQGHTNREVAEELFISPHTVNTHLRQVFAKLGVNSRVELALLAAEHDFRA